MTPFTEHKILAHIDKIADYLGGRFYPPVQVEIDLTNLCTSACPWCAGYLNREWSKATLFAAGDTVEQRWSASVAGVNALIDELAAMGVKSLTWTGGGDPTCHKHWLSFVERAASCGLQNGLITNGVFDVSAAVPYCEWIRFSVDAATQETYGEQHGRPQHFKRVLDNVERASFAASGTGCTVGVGMVTHKGTRREIVDFARLWAGVPVDYIQYRPLHDTHGQAWFSDDTSTMDLIRQAAQVDSRVVWSEPKYAAMLRGDCGKTDCCYGIYFETAIAADGLVYTCCHLKGNAAYAIGNLSKESFAEVWARHLLSRVFRVTQDCPAFCRHFGANQLFEIEITPKRQHENFL